MATPLAFIIRHIFIFFSPVQVDTDGNGYINVSELGDALSVCGFKLPGYEVRDMVRSFDTKIKDDRLELEEFKAVGD